MVFILQEVLKEVLKEKLPVLANHFEEHTVDPSLFTLNWFLCVFVDTLPVKTYLHIWDAFLFEGNKVIRQLIYQSTLLSVSVARVCAKAVNYQFSFFTI